MKRIEHSLKRLHGWGGDARYQVESEVMCIFSGILVEHSGVNDVALDSELE